MRKPPDILCTGALVLLVLAWAKPADAQGWPACTSYVSPTGSGATCSAGLPCNINYAVNNVSGPGAVICVADGFYNTSVFLGSSAPNGTSSQPIVLRAMNMPDVIHGAMPTAVLVASAGGQGLDVQAHSYWTVEGFELDGSINGGDFGIVSSVRSGEGATRGSTGIVVRDNYVHGFHNSGIQLNDGDYVTIAENVVDDCAGVACDDGSGISIYTPTNADTNPGFHDFIQRNISFNNHNPTNCGNKSDGNGIIFDDALHTQHPGTGPYTGTVLIENNLVYGNDGAGIKIYESRGNALVRFNTAYKDRQLANSFSWRGDLDDEANSSPGNTWSSNIVYCDLSQPGNSCINDTYGNSAWSGNITFTGAPGQASFENAGKAPPAGNALGVDPEFSNPTNDFTVQPGSPAISGATVAYGVPSIDLQGDKRSATSPTAGAIEFVGPTPTATATATITATLTGSPKPTATPTSAPTAAPTPTMIPTPSSTPTSTATPAPGVPQATISPTSLQFPTIGVGGISGWKSVRLQNGPVGTLSISMITTGPDFAARSNCPVSLAPGGSCRIRVHFAPQSTGVKSELLTIDDNAKNSPQTVTLNGTAR